MKKTVLILIFSFLSIGNTMAQDCSKFYPFEEGTTVQITSYDRKGKVAATVDNKVLGVSESQGTQTATIEAVVKDDKGKLIATTNYTINCTGNLVSIDFKSLMNPQIFEQFGEMDYEVTGTDLQIPNDISVGQELPDANMDMAINMGGINMNMNVTMKDRKVIGQEDVTTPAGTFNCFIISYNLDMKMGMNQKGSAKQWIAEGVGLVKQEDYNKSGNVTSSSLLTSFSK